ncbi:MAG TPA: hypothetical protein VLV83_10975 [Acidobacteriota bacterium]|nr:hypothetical protein [Acidobacteriota bacterium]
MQRKIATMLLTSMILAATAVWGATETKTGFLIPSQCKSEEGVVPQPKGSTDAWPAPHTTECALRPACIESGYGLWVRDRFLPFDEEGHQKALHYFRTTKRTSYNKVEVSGDFSGDKVQVDSIRPVD